MFNLNPRFNENTNHHANYRHRFNGGVQFRLERMEEDSGVCSPPLWRSLSPPDSPVRFPNSRSLSPASRAQAIARGQREMMEMVENMPETSYELSLKDIVEQKIEYTDENHETQSMEEGEARLISHGGGGGDERRKNSVKRQESNKTGRIIVKNGSMNNNRGFMINMFFPFSIGSNKKKKKKKSCSIRSSSDSSNHGSSGMKTELHDKSDRRDWWKKLTDSRNSESLGISSSSSGSSGSSGSSTASSLRNNSHRKENNCSYGCWSLFVYRKKKS